jgi:hypothetical protein
MDDNGDGTISYEEIAMYLNNAPTEIIERFKQLCTTNTSSGERITYKDMLFLFQTSSRGNIAIDVSYKLP